MSVSKRFCAVARRSFSRQKTLYLNSFKSIHDIDLDVCPEVKLISSVLIQSGSSISGVDFDLAKLFQ